MGTNEQDFRAVVEKLVAANAAQVSAAEVASTASSAAANAVANSQDADRAYAEAKQKVNDVLDELSDIAKKFADNDPDT